MRWEKSTTNYVLTQNSSGGPLEYLWVMVLYGRYHLELLWWNEENWEEVEKTRPWILLYLGSRFPESRFSIDVSFFVVKNCKRDGGTLALSKELDNRDKRTTEWFTLD